MPESEHKTPAAPLPVVEQLSSAQSALPPASEQAAQQQQPPLDPWRSALLVARRWSATFSRASEGVQTSVVIGGLVAVAVAIYLFAAVFAVIEAALPYAIGASAVIGLGWLVFAWRRHDQQRRDTYLAERRRGAQLQIDRARAVAAAERAKFPIECPCCLTRWMADAAGCLKCGCPFDSHQAVAAFFAERGRVAAANKRADAQLAKAREPNLRRRFQWRRPPEAQTQTWFFFWWWS